MTTYDRPADPQVSTTWTRARRLRAVGITGLLIAGGTIALHLRDPHTSGSWGYCPVKLATGLWCPACGGLRAVNDLSHGDLLAALHSNLVFTLSVPLLLLWWAVVFRDRWQGSVRKATSYWPPRTVSNLMLGFIVVFSVLRNTPWGGFLAP